MTSPPPGFAAFSPGPEGSEPLPVLVRSATPADAPAVAAIDARRHGTAADALLPLVLAELEAVAAGDPRRRACVAVHDGRLLGYGRTGHLDPAGDPASRNAPAGWYLTGVVVDPPWRRRGVALALTRHRLDVLAREGAAEAWYFANAANRATHALHARLGFEEVTRDFALPGVAFSGEGGILFRVGLAPRGAGPGRA